MNDIRLEDIKKPTLKEDFETWKRTNFKWADKYIYGIDMDYRLIKTSKISCFLNGDGLANLIHSNGLAKFDCKDYLKILKNEDGNKDNQKFDIIIANPPYSVKYFKNTLPFGAQCFDLYDGLTENSSEIECLFVERAKQLLKKDGFIGIILPSSFLTNGGTYIKAREIILKYFDVKAIMSLDNNAFMATGTKTIVLFMQRRDNLLWQEIQHLVDKFFTDYKDVTVNGIEKAFSTYVKDNFDDLEFEDYVSILKNSPTSKATESELFRDYKGVSNDNIRNIEYDKLLYFTLSYPQKVVVANSGSKDAEKEFLGYDFSNRKGCEGIDVKKDVNGHIISNMYSDTALDDSKVNYYIYNNFNGVDISSKISEINNTAENHPLKGHITYERLSTLIDFSLPVFDKKIDINVKKKIKIESKHKSVRIEDLTSFFSSGVVYNKADESKVKTSNAILTADNITLNNELDIKKVIYLKEDFSADEQKKLKKDDVFICLSSGSISHIGKVSYINKNMDFYAGGFMGILRANKNINSKYLFYILSHNKTKEYIEKSATGNNINNLSSVITKIKIPLPEMDVQHKIVSEIDALEAKSLLLKENIHNKLDVIKKIFCSYNSSVRKRLGDVLSLEYGISLPKHSRTQGIYPVVGSNGIDGYHNKYLLSGPSIIVGRKGSVGKVNLIKANCTPIDTTFYVVIKEGIVFDYAYYLLKELNLEKLNKGLGPGGLNRNDAYALQIQLPSIEEQNHIVSKIQPIEDEIETMEKELINIPQQKQEILDKYLK